MRADEERSPVLRKVYGALLVALGLVVLLRLADGNGLLQLTGVLLVLAGLAVAFLRHADDAPTPLAPPTTATTPSEPAPATPPAEPRPADLDLEPGSPDADA